MENNAQLLKGVLEYCVLRLIEKEPTYGYEIVMQLKQVGFAEISESTLYPLITPTMVQRKPHRRILPQILLATTQRTAPRLRPQLETPSPSKRM